MELRTFRCRIQDKEKELMEQKNEIKEREKEFTEYQRQKERELAEQCEVIQQLQTANIAMSNEIQASKTSSDYPKVSYSVRTLKITCWGIL